MEVLLLVFLCIFAFSMLGVFLNAIFGTLGILLDLSCIVLCSIGYSIIYLLRIVSGKGKKPSFTESFSSDSSVRRRSIRGFNRSTQLINRSTQRGGDEPFSEGANERKYTETWQKKTYKGGATRTHTISIHTSVLRLWNWFVDLFREKEPKK